MAQTTEQVAREDPRAWNDNRERKPVERPKLVIATKVATFRERLREKQLSKKAALGLMLVAAVLTMIVGFKWGGWVTGGAVAKQVSAGAQSAVTLRLTPICVAQFNLDAQKTPKLAELKAIDEFIFGEPDYVGKQGWATMPGETRPDNQVAGACAQLLMAASTEGFGTHNGTNIRNERSETHTLDTNTMKHIAWVALRGGPFAIFKSAVATLATDGPQRQHPYEVASPVLSSSYGSVTCANKRQRRISWPCPGPQQTGPTKRVSKLRSDPSQRDRRS